MRVHVLGRDYDLSVRGFAWEKPETLEAVDGTIEVEVKQCASSNEALGFIHGRLSRVKGGTPFAIPLEKNLVEIVEGVLDYEGDGDPQIEKGEDGGRRRDVETRWELYECPVEKTSAPDYSIDWAALAHEPGSIFFEEGSFLWRMTRHIWVESIIPVETVLVPPSSDLALAGGAKLGER